MLLIQLGVAQATQWAGFTGLRCARVKNRDNVLIIYLVLIKEDTGFEQSVGSGLP